MNNQRILLMIAAGMTAFVLVLIGGVASRVSRPVAASEPPPTVATTPATTLDPTIEALMREREAAYQAALADANARLAQANAQIAQNNQALAAAPAVQPAYDGSPEAAAALAAEYRGGGDVREVELESERNMTVYEVTFADDAAVYVDAATGQVVYAQLAEAEHDENED